MKHITVLLETWFGKRTNNLSKLTQKHIQESCTIIEPLYQDNL